MGTFHDSKFVVARKDHSCVNARCKINKGDLYLSYALGLRNRVAVCLLCSTKPIYRCQATEEAARSTL